jgi:hypothetical protein
MNYSEKDVLDILKSFSEDPEKDLKSWNIDRSNITIDLDKNKFDNFVYSFPVIYEDKKIATITIIRGILDIDKMKKYIIKYLGYENYIQSYCEYSYDHNSFCLFQIFEDFELPELSPTFYGETFIGKDSNGYEFEFKISYGDFESYNGFLKWIDNSYRLSDGINVKVGYINSGWKLGEKINENIKIRLRDSKIESILG